MPNKRNTVNYDDDLNYVVTAQEAAGWYGLQPQDVKEEILAGKLAGRYSSGTYLVSVDSIYSVYGAPTIPSGRRTRRSPKRYETLKQTTKRKYVLQN